MFLSLTVPFQTLLHAFRDTLLDYRQSEADLLLGQHTTDSVLSDLILAERVWCDYVCDVGDVAVSELILACLDSQV